MSQSFKPLVAAGVKGVVMEVWWGIVERDQPTLYNWQGYLGIVEMARRYGLKVSSFLYAISDLKQKLKTLHLLVMT